MSRIDQLSGVSTRHPGLPEGARAAAKILSKSR